MTRKFGYKKFPARVCSHHLVSKISKQHLVSKRSSGTYTDTACPLFFISSPSAPVSFHFFCTQH